MNKWILPAILFLVSAGLIFGAVVALDKDIFKNVKNQGDCDRAKLCKDDPNCCAIWKSGTCRKGKINSQGQCESKADIIPAILLMLAIVAFVIFVIYFVKAFRQK